MSPKCLPIAHYSPFRKAGPSNPCFWHSPTRRLNTYKLFHSILYSLTQSIPRFPSQWVRIYWEGWALFHKKLIWDPFHLTIHLGLCVPPLSLSHQYDNNPKWITHGTLIYPEIFHFRTTNHSPWWPTVVSVYSCRGNFYIYILYYIFIIYLYLDSYKPPFLQRHYPVFNNR